MCREWSLPLLHSVQVSSELMLNFFRQSEIGSLGRDTDEFKLLHLSVRHHRPREVLNEALHHTPSLLLPCYVALSEAGKSLAKFHLAASSRAAFENQEITS